MRVEFRHREILRMRLWRFVEMSEVRMRRTGQDLREALRVPRRGMLRTRLLHPPELLLRPPVDGRRSAPGAHLLRREDQDVPSHAGWQRRGVRAGVEL